MENPTPGPLTVVYAGIGRGHPNYLDSVLRYMRIHHPAQYRQIRITTVFEISHGLSLLGWKMVRALYRTGSRGGLVSDVYTGWRSKKAAHDPYSRLVRILRRDILAYFEGYAGICLVAHPLLANMLIGKHRVFYLHGEIAAPPESGIIGAEKIFVPLPVTKEKMAARGVPASSLVTTGLVLEPELYGNVDEAADRRIERIGSPAPLTVGFFISGAYPRRHTDLILKGAASCLAAGMRIRLFWGCNAREIRRVTKVLWKFCGPIIIDDGNDAEVPDAQAVIVTGVSREAETIKSMAYLPELDLFCAAPHERINWAVGAGLPMIMITPTIGTFAPENRAFVLAAGSGLELSDATEFASLGKFLMALRNDGALRQMAIAGRKINSGEGTKVIAEDLLGFLAHG